ncbi:MAG: hypothetical protein ABSC26_01145 [Stellaceae bacterium]|jgi:hypothetical protein
MTKEIPTVSFDATKVTETVKTDLNQNLQAIQEIPSGDFEAIYDAALRSISVGRALDVLYQALMTLDGMSKRRAKEISLSLNNKATALMNAEQQERLGIKYAIWCYSGAPCGERDSTHKAANGKPYLVSKGMHLNGRWTRPGREDGCKCVSRSMIAGFDGYDGDKPEGLVD